MNTKHLIPALSAAILSFGTAMAGGEGWSHDFEAAKKQAAAEHKDLLLDFTGSDWCVWCKKLDKEVFDHDEFKNGVKDKFILVSLDFPQDKEKAGVTPEIEEQNAKLAEQFGVEGYPTIMLVDATGKPYAKTGYEEGGAEKYVTALDELRSHKTKRDEAFAKADKEGGVDKAKSLVAAIKALDLGNDLTEKTYGDTLDKIKEADPKDESGYFAAIKEEKENAAKLEEFEAKLDGFAQNKDAEGALALVDETVKGGTFKGEPLQQIKLVRASILASEEKFDEALKAVDEAKTVAPDSETASHLDEFKAQLEKAKSASAAEKKDDGDEKKEKKDGE